MKFQQWICPWRRKKMFKKKQKIPYSMTWEYLNLSWTIRSNASNKDSVIRKRRWTRPIYLQPMRSQKNVRPKNAQFQFPLSHSQTKMIRGNFFSKLLTRSAWRSKTRLNIRSKNSWAQIRFFSPTRISEVQYRFMIKDLQLSLLRRVVIRWAKIHLEWTDLPSKIAQEKLLALQKDFLILLWRK